MTESDCITVSCIIPAFNEAARIDAVLSAVVGHPLIHEVIVVDDRSRDATVNVARRRRVRVIQLKRNQGKSAAVAQGVAASHGSHILLLDADLVGLSTDDITALIYPVLHHSVDATISLRSNSPLLWRAIGLDYISGERVFPRSLVADRLKEMRQLPRFGLEVWLNSLWIELQLHVQVVGWSHVISPLKGRKMGWWRGIRADARMMCDIFRTISPRDALQQIYALQRSRFRGN
ncbi:glycosyltransferase family 2 protein [Candidatus Pantoea multigeneris]|uniref:Glycosyltransferase family 2 protein n=1 Tax=Candidatus Pantoea multigeneris TaxID=2608357 RepID=A0ABX0RGJ5_9GAMM|nr:glycosyltransferase family 2 protein [Pantoea multigeneris]NIF23411.1 glycosyltransferase family 2 protein [Pantoea multigeneris]